MGFHFYEGPQESRSQGQQAGRWVPEGYVEHVNGDRVAVGEDGKFWMVVTAAPQCECMQCH